MVRYAKALIALPILAVFLASGTPASARGDFGVNLNLNLGPPPVLVSPPSDLVLIPSIGVYFVPGISADIFFYDGYWWAPRGPRWYRSDSPRGPWVITGGRYVPQPLYRIPRDYRSVYRHERHIPYSRWERERGGRWGRGDQGGRSDRGDRRGGWERGDHGGGWERGEHGRMRD